MTVTPAQIDSVIADARRQALGVFGEDVSDNALIRVLACMVAIQRASLARMAGDVSPGYVRANPAVTSVLNLDGKKPL